MSSATASIAAPSRSLRLLSYAAIYFLWGASFLAIRVVVAQVPPLLAAGFRFLTAGLALFLWALLRGAPFPNMKQWRSAVFLGVGMFALDYGPLFWAEQRVASGIAAIISALIPVWVAAFAWTGSARAMPPRLLLGTACGLAGVVVLSLTPDQGSARGTELLPLAALLLGTFAWAFGTLWTQKLPLPASKPMSASIQMMVGGLALTLVSVAVGNAHSFRPSHVTGQVVLSMLYLILGASILAFTAYVWLLGHEPPTRVSSYAYVNPVIAVLLGWSLGGERLSIQVVLGMLLVLAAVIAVLGERKTAR